MTDPALEGLLRAAAGRVRTIRAGTDEVADALAWESLTALTQAWQSGAASQHDSAVRQAGLDVKKISDTLGELASALEVGAKAAHEAVLAEAAAKAEAEAKAAAAAKAGLTK